MVVYGVYIVRLCIMYRELWKFGSTESIYIHMLRKDNLYVECMYGSKVCI